MKHIKWADAIGKTVTAFRDDGTDLIVAFGDEYATAGMEDEFGDCYFKINTDINLSELDQVGLGYLSKDEYNRREIERKKKYEITLQAHKLAEYERLKRELGK